MDPTAPRARDSPPGSPAVTPLLRTVLLCDLVESTALVERLGDARAASLLQRHDQLLRQLMALCHGQLVDKADGVLALFERPVQALDFALRYQRGLVGLGIAEGLTLQARIGIHVGDVMTWANTPQDVRDGAKPFEVEGLAKPVAARLMGLALPGQVLMSGMAQNLAQRAQGELGELGAGLRWLMHGRYRFKGVPAPMLVHEVGEPGLSPLRAPPSGAKAWRELPLWRRPPVVALELLLTAGIAAGLAWTTLRSPPAIAFAERDWVVVADLQNHTRERAYDDALDTAFRLGLEQSRYLNVIPEMQAREALARMQRQGQAVDRKIGLELAQREGARALVLPSVTDVGGVLRVGAELIDPATGATVVSEFVDSPGSDQVLPAMDQVLVKLRGRLGESLASIGKSSSPLAQITTANLEALKIYSMAEAELGKGALPGARVLVERALELDPEFAMAWMRLGTLQSNVFQQPGEALASFRRAQSLRGRLSTREALYVDGILAWMQGTAEDSAERWSAITVLYPDYVSAQMNLGLTRVWYTHDVAAALPSFEAVARSQHPQRGYGWMALGLSQLELGQDDAARASMASGLALVKLAPNYEFTLPALAARDWEQFDRLLGPAPLSLPPSFQVEWQLRRLARAVDRDERDEAAKGLQDLEALLAKPGVSATLRAKVRLAGAAWAVAEQRPDAGRRLRELIDTELAREAAGESAFDRNIYVHLAAAALLAERLGERALAGEALGRAVPDDKARSYAPVGKTRATAQCLADHAGAGARAACLRDVIDGREYFQARVALHDALVAAGDAAGAREQRQWLLGHRGAAVAETGEQTFQIVNLLDLRRLAAAQAAPGP